MLLSFFQHTEGALQHLKTEKRTIYFGTDITAPALHAGHLIMLMHLKELIHQGHRVIVLLGGATSLIGDPTDKMSQRKMLSQKEIDDNIANIRKCVQRVLGLDVQFVNNADWLSKISFIDMLREVGSKISVNKLIKMKTFETRIKENKNLSLLEICYPLCQGYDFVYLNKHYNCTVQCGGSDQWGNIVMGTKLKDGLHGITCRLLTNPDGTKISKSSNSRAWLDPEMTSPFELWQFFRNLDDRTISDLNHLAINADVNINKQKEELANLMIKSVYGDEKSEECYSRAQGIFKNANIDLLEECEVENELPLYKIVCKTGLAKSNSEAKRLIEQGGVKIDKEIIREPYNNVTLPKSIRVGKRGYRLVVKKA